jgi:formylglycine-generating enzyme required for sulfatase activity
VVAVQVKDRIEKAARVQKRHQALPPGKVERIQVGATFIEMVPLAGGSFMMGSRDGDDDERPMHKVTLRPFSIGRFEVTQRQWQGVMGTSPSYFAGCADCPVDSVSWDDIQLFIARLNRQSGKRFRLPSEAEWEYACHAGGSEAYCGDNDETQVAWYAENSDGRPQPVGQLAPNGFGLYDMSGNAYEWVADCWHGGYGEAPIDGSAWGGSGCQRRVLRGGAWYYAPDYSLSTYRNANTPESRFIIYGLRLAQDV